MLAKMSPCFLKLAECQHMLDTEGLTQEPLGLKP